MANSLTSRSRAILISGNLLSIKYKWKNGDSDISGSNSANNVIKAGSLDVKAYYTFAVH